MAKSPKSKKASDGDADATKPGAERGTSPSSVLRLLSLVGIVLAVAGGWIVQQDVHLDDVALDFLRMSGLLQRVDTRVLSTLGVLPGKYESDVVKVETRHLVTDLSCEDAEFMATPLLDGKLFPVTQPMEAAERMASDRVFFLLNGRNDGVYVSWNGQFDCVGQAAEVAAVWLGADRDVLANGVRLYSQMGWPVRNAAELAASKNIVHILLD
ncbi:hypothetical protein BBJ28_00017609, partial [Nothophytophthora sp. Chile5]